MNVANQVVEILNQMLILEMTAFHQYVLHSKMCEDWSLKDIAEKVMERANSELEDAKGIVDLILLYGGEPDLGVIKDISVGKDVRQQFQYDFRIGTSCCYISNIRCYSLRRA